MSHRYSVTGTWRGGRAGEGTLDNQGTMSSISLPREIGGSGVGTNADELLVSAVATCYLATLGIVFEKNEIPIERIDVAATLRFDPEKLKITRIDVKPAVTFRGDLEPLQRERLPALYARAKQFCVISNALAGNVEVNVSH